MFPRCPWCSTQMLRMYLMIRVLDAHQVMCEHLGACLKRIGSSFLKVHACDWGRLIGLTSATRVAPLYGCVEEHSARG
jgi:hypothetical protein